MIIYVLQNNMIALPTRLFRRLSRKLFLIDPRLLGRSIYLGCADEAVYLHLLKWTEAELGYDLI